MGKGKTRERRENMACKREGKGRAIYLRYRKHSHIKGTRGKGEKGEGGVCVCR